MLSVSLMKNITTEGSEGITMLTSETVLQCTSQCFREPQRSSKYSLSKTGYLKNVHLHVIVGLPFPDFILFAVNGETKLMGPSFLRLSVIRTA